MPALPRRLLDLLPRRRSTRLALAAALIAALVPLAFAVHRYRSNAELERLLLAGRFGGNLYTSHWEGRVNHGLVILSETNYGPLPAIGRWLQPNWWRLGEPERISTSGPGCDLRELFPRLAELDRLERIDLDECGEIGDELGRVAGSMPLKDLFLTRMHVSPEAVRELRRFENLEGLHLWRSTGIDDEAARAIGELHRLRELNLARTAVTDAGVERLAGLRRLDRLSLYGTRITDGSVPTLIRITPRRLDVSKTGLTSDGVARLRSALPQTNLAADH